MIVYVDPRTCVDCGLRKPGDCFDVLAPRRDGSRGRRAYCRECRYQRTRSANLRRARRHRRRLKRTAEGREKMRRSARESKRRRRRLSPEQHEREKESSRRWHHAAYHGDPEYRERLLAKQKEWRRQLREKRAREERLRVRPEPILGYIEERSASLIRDGEADVRGGMKEVMRRAGLDEALIRRWRDDGRLPYLDQVDQILTRLGEPPYVIEVLYPEIDELLADPDTEEK